jgi:glycosyltransferase involved in cell wall biosynthesis
MDLMRQLPGGKVKLTLNDPELPLITTIIPTYRRPDRLKKAIRSILNQTYPRFQICVYDNASEDATAEIVAKFAQEDARVKYHCHVRNIGAGENFQYGLDRVKTPFFSFLSDDDFLLPEFYETALRGFKNYPDATFSMGAVIDVNDEGEALDIILSRWPEKELFSPPEGLLEMIGKYSNWAGILFRKEIIDKVGPLDLNLKAIDIDYMFRAAACSSFVVSKKPCAVFVQHSSSYSGYNGLKLIWPGWQMMISKLHQAQLSVEVQALAEQKLKIDLQNLLLMNVFRSLEKKKFDEATSVTNIFNQNCQRKWMKQFLAITIKICKAFPLVQKLLVLMLTMRRLWLRRIKRASIQSEYRKWKGFLQ